MFLSMSSSEAHTSGDHFLFLFLSQDFHELWRTVISVCLLQNLISYQTHIITKCLGVNGMFLSMHSSKAHTSRDHFFLFFCLQTFMN